MDYARALDEGDNETVDRILSAALDDPALDALLSDVDRAFLEAEGLPSAQAAAEVEAAVQRNLAPTATDTAPLTVGRVAASLKANGRVPTSAHDYNEALLSSTALPPRTYRASDVEALLTEIAPAPTEDYVDAFSSETARLSLASQPAPARLAARSIRRDGAAEGDAARDLPDPQLLQGALGQGR
ncbi:MAG: hypothetical protein AAFX41_00290, partial [Bacteroidota bacterium]